MNVGTHSDSGIWKVQLLDMGMSISEKLTQSEVGVELATPVAVSTKVKQVFSPDGTEDVIAKLYQAISSDTVGKYG